MTSLTTALILFSTVTLAVALGVGTGYLIITAILHAFANKATTAKPPAPALATQGVAGD